MCAADNVTWNRLEKHANQYIKTAMQFAHFSVCISKFVRIIHIFSLNRESRIILVTLVIYKSAHYSITISIHDV
jgi:hypothetical protein